MSPDKVAEIKKAAIDRPRRLLLCLDGVPYEIIRRAKSRGLFGNFNAPAKLLSPFPTLTNVALSNMLGATPPAGYESLYFDRNTCELRGGINKYVGRRTADKIPSSYMELLDYQEPLPFEFLVYVAPEAVWKADMRRFHEKFRSAPVDRDYFAFLKGTDGLLHIRGAGRLEAALVSLDDLLRRIQSACGVDTEIVLFSDHGMNLERNQKVHLQTRLKKSGFDIRGNLNGAGKRSVAIPAFGLCGYAAIYCADKDVITDAAGALTDLEGVDFCLTREGPGSIRVSSGTGTAIIDQRTNGKVNYRYLTATGDPLKLAPAIQGLVENQNIDGGGYASDDAWFNATAEHDYPDALSNLFHALQPNRVGHTADLLVSMKDGYYFGSTAFGHFVTLEATHGNALSASTNAFLMSTHRNLPAVIRAQDSRPFLRH